MFRLVRGVFKIVPKRVRWMGFGALGAYLFDPERGRARRIELADRASAVMRKTGDRLEKQTRYAAGKVQGLGHVGATPESATAGAAVGPSTS